MTTDDLPWMIVQEKVEIFDRSPAYVWCDRRQHLLILYYEANKNASIASSSSSSSTSTISMSDHSTISNGRSPIRTSDVQIVIYLERIQYIQRGGGGTSHRSARNYHPSRLTNPNEQHDRQQRQLEIYYSTDYPRSEYLYKHVAFQLKSPKELVDKWVNALFVVIDEAKTLNEVSRRNRWILREYEKLRRSCKGLTFDSINGWLNSHIGLVGEKKNVIKLIEEHDVYNQPNLIPDSLFKAIYNHFYDIQQEALIKILMPDIIIENQILLKIFALCVTNNEPYLFEQELDNITKFLRLDSEQTEIPLNKCLSYLWSDANSAFDPISRTKCTDDMTQPLNHYWISSSHNTYLAKTQLFNPASIHCYIQALLSGCRCVEIDVVDSRLGGLEPEITHKNTRIKPLPLRDVLEAIHDYAFITSEYPVIISIENHCSPEQRFLMSQMFIEIFRENLLQSPLSSDETHLPSPDQLKRKIILKDSKINNKSMTSSQIIPDSEEQLDVPSSSLVGHVQLFDFIKTVWLQYNYWFKEEDLFLAKDDDIRRQKNSNDDSSDDEQEENLPTDDLTQIWYHRNLTHQEARSLLLSNSSYEIGTFLARKSANKNCYCITFLAFASEVKSIEIRETRDEDGKCLYSLSQKKFDTILDLVSHYRTYDFAEVIDRSSKQVSYRLGRPLPRVTWRQELEKQAWYQPNLTKKQSEELLSDIREEMTFLIRKSSTRARQDYTISVYTNNSIRHSPIYREGEDLMLMSKTFTSLIELVNYFSHKPIFRKLTLKTPAKSYEEFLTEQHRFEAQEINRNLMTFRPLNHDISLKVNTLKAVDIDDFKIQLCIQEENRKEFDGYFLKFDLSKDCKMFSTTIRHVSSPFDDTASTTSSNSSEKLSTKTTINTPFAQQLQACLAEFSKLIIYCQAVKLKEFDINKAHDLLVHIKSFKEMISLNYVKADTFCRDLECMIQFNQKHFTRIYPDFSRRSWSSHNFEPIPYWSAGCQMVALNFQMPDRPMYINAGRFAANGGCGYVLMPKYIRFFDTNKSKVETTSKLITIRVVAVRHLRTVQAKSILKVHVKTTLVNKQKHPQENPSCITTITGSCGIWDAKQLSKYHDQIHAYDRFQSADSTVDILYFDVSTDNQEFCGQSAIPVSSLRTGIRSVPLYDRFNERLDMSALLVDIHL